MNTRPYIILNNTNSQTIPGLLISSLPPISKPQQRIKTETIDGKDGDIVTPLGFGSYDKTLNIGLTYDYNIDDIIDYFNSEGKVVFSNEPEKYYKYAIYKQIDFERLVRFKKAKVVFHVQPFKFSDTETEKTFYFTQVNGALTIRNNGNYFSRPILTIVGSGDIYIYINNVQILKLTLNANQTIIIDSEAMNAYNLSGELLNRLVNGNYDKIRLKTGSNIISYGGDLRKISIKNYSRWL